MRGTITNRPPVDSAAARALRASVDSMETVTTMLGNTTPLRSGRTGRVWVRVSATLWSFRGILVGL